MLMKASEISAFADLKAEEYHADKKIIGHSALVRLLQSPKHYWHALNTPHIPTPALLFGTALHAAVLEPELFRATYTVQPKFDRRTKDGKAAAEEWLLANSGKTPLPAEEEEAIKGIVQSVREHRRATQLLKNGFSEKSYFWEDPDTGIQCRVRPDFLICDQEGRVIGILDLKSARSAAAPAFAKAMVTYGYDLQAAFYQDAVAHAIGRVVPFYFLAMESAAPHGVALYRTGERTLDVGRSKYRAALQMLQWCREKDFWPSYQPFGEEEEIDVPHWERSLDEA